ncbi:unnamed protein product [Tuber aestivum]|uniref:Cytochrome b5 heme-binding domain-containing protein n=1 Tax=Tuber aestivum TaxID=59557 RepID=A0A292PTB9_9PEZI|nr:unnamed protein product [Tuber aestivum]
MGWMRKTKDRKHDGEDGDLVEMVHIEDAADGNSETLDVKLYSRERVPFLEPKVVAKHTSVEAGSICEFWFHMNFKHGHLLAVYINWIVIDGIVYDVTTFPTEHPGGAEIIEYFGGQDCSWQSHLEQFKDKLRIGRAEGLENRWPEPKNYMAWAKGYTWW